jgi:hypothetical protein
MRFKDFLHLYELAVNIPDVLGTVIPSGVFGATPLDEPKDDMRDPNPVHPSMGDFTLSLPQVTITSAIRQLDDKRNPILIQLDNNTLLFIQPDAFRKIKGEPRIGKMMTVVLQRRPEDKSPVPSKIISCYCH